MKIELEVVENQILLVLDMALKETPSRWWGTHKEKINNWYQCKRLLHIIFGIEKENIYMEKYDKIGKCREHMYRCIIQWRLVLPKECPYHFIHTLEGISRNWYTEMEQRKETTNWDDMQQKFLITFAFEHENLEIDTTLKVVREIIFEEPKVEIVAAYQN
jgi:hypothetical protein